MAYLSGIRDLWELMRYRKKYWLLPLLVILLLIAALVFVTQSSALAPFLYPLF